MLEQAIRDFTTQDRIAIDRFERRGPHRSSTIPVRMVKRGGAKVAIGPDGQSAIRTTKTDPALGAALIRAEAWKRQLLSGEASISERDRQGRKRHAGLCSAGDPDGLSGPGSEGGDPRWTPAVRPDSRGRHPHAKCRSTGTTSAGSTPPPEAAASPTLIRVLTSLFRGKFSLFGAEVFPVPWGGFLRLARVSVQARRGGRLPAARPYASV